MSKIPPFVANDTRQPDRCALAVYRMITQYFFGRDMTWQQMAAFAGYQDGVIAWSVKALTQFARMGLTVRTIDPFDYARFAIEGEAYLATVYPPDQAEWYAKNTNVLSLPSLIPEFLQTVQPECRRVELKDIDMMLASGMVASLTVNSKALNGQSGFAPHMILVYGREGSSYLAHDSGLPAMEARKIPADLLYTAMGGDQSTAELTGLKIDKIRGARLDQWVTYLIPDLSRAYAARLVSDGKVSVNQRVEQKPGYKLRSGDQVEIDYDLGLLSNIPAIELPVLYEDDDCVVIDKPAGVLMHARGGSHTEATVATWLRSQVKNIDGNRAGIVHRLDRATSGVVICAKTPEALAWLQRQFAERKAHKVYQAVISGKIEPPEAVIDMPIERNPKRPATFRVGKMGKSAQTHYETLEQGDGGSLIQLKPVTGRTHQLRVHLAERGHPIIGDVLYGGKLADRLYLHAVQLGIQLPNGQEKIFVSEPPAGFLEKLK